MRLRHAPSIAALTCALACSSSGAHPGAAPGSATDAGPMMGGGHSGPGSDSGAVGGRDGSPTGDANLPPVGGGLGAATFGPGDLDAPSHGGTITFQQVGAAGWYPSRRDPAVGPCDAYQSSTCCLATDTITGDDLTPWDEELVMTLRGPMVVKQLAVYQPGASTSDWDLVSGWDSRQPTVAEDMAFSGDATPMTAFSGGVGSECQINVATKRTFPCGAASSPYCPMGAETNTYGWAGSKLFVLLAKMAHAGTGAPEACSTTTTGNWYDASWVGLAVGELARAGAYASCQCFAKDPTMWALANGCGQFNVFEVVNDNDSSKNLDVFSTDLIDYSGYVGQGPCGPKCNVSALSPAVDLIDKTNDTEAAEGATATPSGGPSAALRRPESGYRYFLILLDVPSRTVQLALVHPENIPSALAPLLPALPATIPASTESALVALRLPM